MSILGTRFSVLGSRLLLLDAGQIMDDLAPISRLEGDIFYRGYWILDKHGLFPLRRQANPPTGVIRKEPVPQLREG